MSDDLVAAWEQLAWGLQVHRYYLHVAPLRQTGEHRPARALSVAKGGFGKLGLGARAYLSELREATGVVSWRTVLFAQRPIVVVDEWRREPDAASGPDRAPLHNRTLTRLETALVRCGLLFLPSIASDVIIFGPDPCPNVREACVRLPPAPAGSLRAFISQSGRQLANWFIDYSIARHRGDLGVPSPAERSAVCARVERRLLAKAGLRCAPLGAVNPEELAEAVGGSLVVRDLLTLCDDDPGRRFSAYEIGLGMGQS